MVEVEGGGSHRTPNAQPARTTSRQAHGGTPALQGTGNCPPDL